MVQVTGRDSHYGVKRNIASNIGGHGETFPYTSSIFSVYVVVENVWTPLSASFSRLLQRSVA